MIFWHKIVIFHTKYPKNFGASLSVPPPNLKSWIRPCSKSQIFVQYYLGYNQTKIYLPITTDSGFFSSEMCVFYLTLLLNTDHPIVIVM